MAAAKKIQTWWRSRHMLRTFRRVIRPRFRRIIRHFQRLAKVRAPRLRLGGAVKRIQRVYRLHLFRLRRFRAGQAILGFYRHQQWRMRRRQQYFEKLIMSARLIQSHWKAFKCRRVLELRRARKHMAAFKIYSKINSFFKIQRIQRQRRLEEQMKRMSIIEMKRQKLLEKRTEVRQRTSRLSRYIISLSLYCRSSLVSSVASSTFKQRRYSVRGMRVKWPCGGRRRRNWRRRRRRWPLTTAPSLSSL